MTSSLLFTTLAAALHFVVLFEVRRFFKSNGRCQESDKHLVAVAGVGSVCFILVQIAQIVGAPIWYEGQNMYAGLWSGLAIFNAAIYYGLAKIMADRRISSTGMDATDVRCERKKLTTHRQENVHSGKAKGHT